MFKQNENNSQLNAVQPLLKLLSTRAYLDQLISDLVTEMTRSGLTYPFTAQQLVLFQDLNSAITDYTACGQFSALPACEEQLKELDEELMNELMSNAIAIGYLSNAIASFPSRSGISHLLDIFISRQHAENKVLEVILTDTLTNEEILEKHSQMMFHTSPEQLSQKHYRNNIL